MRQLKTSKKRKIPFKVEKTNIANVFTIARPPRELNVKTAGLRTLLQHGLFVKRPSPQADPKLIAAWNETVGEIWRAQNFVVPYLEPQIGVTHQLKDLKPADTGYTSTNWSGAALVGTWSGVFGKWTIPTVSKPQTPPRPDGTWHSSSWVGLDGLSGVMPGGNSTDVLQAGVTQKVDAQGQASYYAWFEWYVPPDQPDGTYSQGLKNAYPYIFETQFLIETTMGVRLFPVTAGDNVAVVVQYLQHSGDIIGNVLPPPGPYSIAGVSIANLTKHKYTSTYLLPPTGASFSGDSAEWIMELPDQGLGTLPVFTPVYFDMLGACNSNNSPSLISDNNLITLTDQQFPGLPNVLAPNTAESAGEASLTISYVV
jgi:hypothetical protein